MLVIELERFYPTESKDFYVDLIVPSNQTKISAISKLSKAPMIDPESEVNGKKPDFDPKRINEFHDYNVVLVNNCVKKVAGLKIGDTQLETAEQLIALAPDYIFQAIVGKLHEMMEIPLDLKKK